MSAISARKLEAAAPALAVVALAMFFAARAYMFGLAIAALATAAIAAGIAIQALVPEFFAAAATHDRKIRTAAPISY